MVIAGCITAIAEKNTAIVCLSAFQEQRIIKIHTENLTILFVDIAGFTITTSRLSRQENADLLQTFGRVLQPLIKGYEGKLIKSIGDAYLITFLSPTDAMLCSMALQDAMHGNNLKVIEEEKIHIRIAANLGEVRVAKNDIFGEPVNVASRIEGVTPADAIYLSEAVYMAMNKAEVPVEEIGFKDLAGVSQSVRLYCIPRFSVNRLVPEKRTDLEVGNELVYPYGGMHCHANNDTRFTLDFSENNKKARLSLSVLLIFITTIFVSWYFNIISFNSLNNESAVPIISPKIDLATNSKVKEKTLSGEVIFPEPSEPIQAEKTVPAPVLIPLPNIKSSHLTKKQQPSDKIPVPAQKTAPVKDTTFKEAIKSTPVNTKVVVKTKPAVKPKVSTPAKTTWNVRKAKLAYRDETLSKAEYNEVIKVLKAIYKKEITKIKADYNSGKITKVEYKALVTKAKNKYKGN